MNYSLTTECASNNETCNTGAGCLFLAMSTAELGGSALLTSDEERRLCDDISSRTVSSIGGGFHCVRCDPQSGKCRQGQGTKGPPLPSLALTRRCTAGWLIDACWCRVWAVVPTGGAMMEPGNGRITRLKRNEESSTLLRIARWTARRRTAGWL